MSTPEVSICIPAYNYGHFLVDALDSAIAQTFTDTEIVVVDNCSTDDTVELVDRYVRKDERVVIYRNDQNIGMTANFNKALDLARGKYIKYLCADDVLASDCVERMVRAMEAKPEVRLVAGRRLLFGPGSLPALEKSGERRYATKIGTLAITECFFRGNYIGEPTAVMFRKRDVKSGFDDSYHQAIDVDMWFRLLERGALAYFHEPVCGIRVHESTGTAGNLRGGRITAGKIRLFQRYARMPYMQGHLVDKILWDARMASSLAKQAAAGSSADREAALAATYHPAFAKNALLPLAAIVTRLQRSG